MAGRRITRLKDKTAKDANDTKKKIKLSQSPQRSQRRIFL
jgi:hypothetical protein